MYEKIQTCITQKINSGENLKSQFVRKLKISNCEKTQKTQIVRKLKNSNCAILKLLYN